MSHCMRIALLAAAAASLFSCSPDDGTAKAAPPTSGPSAAPAPAAKTPPTVLAAADVAAIWPEDKSKIFANTQLVVGLPGQTVAGRIAVLRGGKPVAKGQPVAAGADVALFAAGVNEGEIALPPGAQTVCVQVLDAAGTSMGPEWAREVSYTVVPNPPARRVFFVEPKDGATVGTKLHMKFGVEGLGMSPAGENLFDKTVGHHHVLVQRDAMPSSEVIPNDGTTHIHYGKAQTEADLELKPGTYRLTMQFADGSHRSYGGGLAETITVHVK